MTNLPSLAHGVSQQRRPSVSRVEGIVKWSALPGAGLGGGCLETEIRPFELRRSITPLSHLALEPHSESREKPMHIRAFEAVKKGGLSPPQGLNALAGGLV